eukprot:1522700-Rhodomonas_salina.1
MEKGRGKKNAGEVRYGECTRKQGEILLREVETSEIREIPVQKELLTQLKGILCAVSLRPPCASLLVYPPLFLRI